ncbi:DoxX-like protein [Algoriphagus aquaeductus]|uniref:DoxX-like protein n=2 Tax=Algoriphagus aquaeductus TaxID=475299 RepID=A0A326RPL5_9BACT|nr:DoxX-like protein [Algoriphagus aquaeductus]
MAENFNSSPLTIFKHLRNCTMKNPNPKWNRIIYWTTTGLFSLFMISSAIPNLLQAEEWVEVFQALGYPLYLLPFLGTAKILGVIAILVPGFPKLKEWAYAGFTFNLSGAIYSGIAAAGFDPKMLVLLGPIALGVVSYLYHRKRSV